MPKYSLEVIKKYVETSPSLGDVLYYLESGLEKTRKKLKKKRKKSMEKSYNKLVSPSFTEGTKIEMNPYSGAFTGKVNPDLYQS